MLTTEAPTFDLDAPEHFHCSSCEDEGCRECDAERWCRLCGADAAVETCGHMHAADSENSAYDWQVA